jgi:hypothetical protein
VFHGRSIQNSLGQQQGLPFVDLLTPDMLREVAELAAESSEPIYAPLATLCMFLGQVVDPDHSCRQAVPLRAIGFDPLGAVGFPI